MRPMIQGYPRRTSGMDAQSVFGIRTLRNVGHFQQIGQEFHATPGVMLYNTGETEHVKSF